MNRLVLGIVAAIVIGLGTLSVYADSREAEAENLRQKLLVQERRAEEEKTLPDASPPRKKSGGEERPTGYYEILPDGGVDILTDIPPASRLQRTDPDSEMRNREGK